MFPIIADWYAYLAARRTRFYPSTEPDGNELPAAPRPWSRFGSITSDFEESAEIRTSTEIAPVQPNGMTSGES